MRRLQVYIDTLKRQGTPDDEDIWIGGLKPERLPDLPSQKTENPESPNETGQKEETTPSGKGQQRPAKDAVQKFLDDLIGIILLHPLFRRMPPLIVPPGDVLRDPKDPKDPA